MENHPLAGLSTSPLPFTHSLGLYPPATLRKWVRRTEVDAGQRAGVTSGERERLQPLERENRELRRANEILRAAAAFFARELDPRLPKP